MKKIVLMMTMCTLISPFSTDTFASGKKHVYKDLPAKASKEEVKEASWLDNVSGSMDFTSNYMFRGISLSEDNPAIQGGLTYTFPVGLYFNLWGSNAHYSAPDGKLVSSEFDTIAGWQGSFLTDFSYNVNFARYNYPGARKANYNEANSLWTYKIFTLGLSYSANYSGTHASGTYVNGTINYDVPAKYVLGIEDVSVLAEMGHYSLARAAGNSYNDYSVGVNKKISDKYTLSLLGTGTNGRAKMPPFDGNQIVGTVTATF